MYRIDDMATWREYRRDLLREAEEARSGPVALHGGAGGNPDTDGILAGAGRPELIGPEDGGKADPVDRGPVIDAVKKGST